MNARELLSVGTIGLRTRRLRAALSALGSAIGISAIAAGLGISAPSQANLLAQIDALGTNLLTASPGQQVLGGQAQLNPTAVGKIAHIRGVPDVGIMRPLPLAPELDPQVLIELPAAERAFGITNAANEVHVRADTDAVTSVRALLARSANPEHPEVVQVSRPSDALAARAAARGSYDILLLGLGAVALHVGGVGIANVMIIPVIERRGEIGLRRALGATRRDIASQFLTESLMLSLFGGTAGAALGFAVTAAYAAAKNLPVALSMPAFAGGIAAALVIGVGAGVYPGLRAAALAPTEALRAVYTG
jgi:putative ABC transport system permease protein